MGTYTANYQLYMPSIGEQGWGDLMNGNLTTIDTTMKGLNTRIGTLETETDAVEERLATIEKNISFDSEGNIVGNVVGTATKLNTTVNVSVSTTTMSLRHGQITLCPYVPGVKYTGKINGGGAWDGNGTRYNSVAILNSSGWTMQTLIGELSINNVLCVIVYVTSINLGVPVNLPIFS